MSRFAPPPPPQVHLQDDQSVSNLAPLYSRIIEPFTKYQTCFVYVTGLQHVHDRLLKWVAEYTKSVPWAYVYFEGVDTTWNLPENTDRIFFHSDVLNNDARTKVRTPPHPCLPHHPQIFEPALFTRNPVAVHGQPTYPRVEDSLPM